jgi:hypothetical protein
MEDDLTLHMKKKNEILKRIEENKRLMELIRNPYIKDTLGPLKMMKKNIAVKKIQKFWRKRRDIKLKNLEMMQSNLIKGNNKSNLYRRLSSKSSLNSQNMSNSKSDNLFSINFKIIIIQRAFRNYLSNKSKALITNHYVQEYTREFFAPLKYDRVNVLKNEMINKIKSKEMPSRSTDFQEVLNEYYTRYKSFNEDFPDFFKLRTDNLSKYYQCMSLVNHMSTQTDLNKMNKFNDFYLNVKKEQTGKKLNSILDSIEHKMWWYKYRDMDDFEENNIVNEIDSHFQFQRIGDILSKK